MGESSPAADQLVLIIGAMKSGTSALFDLLSQHPQICPSAIKEPEYFSAQQGHGLSVARYEELWDFDPGVHSFAMEASTGYTKYPVEQGVAQRIAAAGLRPKFIYVVRDPVDRISSQVVYGSWGRKGTTPNFLDPHPVAISSYAMQLDQYLAVFPRESFLLVDNAALLNDPERTAAEVFAFLGLPPVAITPPVARKNAARPRSAWERRLMSRGRVARLAKATPSSLKSTLRRVSATGSAARPTMTAAEESQLRAMLADDVARLHQEWGFDVSSWGFEPARIRDAS